MTAPELKPCPFCGGEAELLKGEECAYVQCIEVKMHRAMFIDGDNNAASEAVVEWNRRAALEPQPDHRELTVWYGKMPESNGRENWTAILRPKAGDHMSGLLDGFCFARSEYPDRVRYEADRMRWIIGELTEKPYILAYDADLHSGYVEQPDPRDEVIARLVEAATDANQALVDAAEEIAELRLAMSKQDLELPWIGDAIDKLTLSLAAAKAVQTDGQR